MSEGLLYVLSEPGAVPEEEFHDWYDTEHAPARLAVPGVRNALRYRAADGRTPSWMACYDLDPGALDTPEYARLRSGRSPREQRVVDGLAVLDRRVYELLDSHGELPDRAAERAPFALCVAMSTGDETALHDWYLGEHIPLLHTLPGWWRTRRFRLREGTGPRFLAVHDLAGTALFETETYRHATSTPLRARVLREVTERERRLFRFHGAVGGEGGEE